MADERVGALGPLADIVGPQGFHFRGAQKIAAIGEQLVAFGFHTRIEAAVIEHKATERIAIIAVAQGERRGQREIGPG